MYLKEKKKDFNRNEKVEILLEFKKKTRAHKWCNYAVYGLLTLSQLSKTGVYRKFGKCARKGVPIERKRTLLLKHTLAFPQIISKIDFTEIGFTEINLTKINFTKIILTISISIKHKAMFYYFLLLEKKLRRYLPPYLLNFLEVSTLTVLKHCLSLSGSKPKMNELFSSLMNTPILPSNALISSPSCKR